MKPLAKDAACIPGAAASSLKLARDGGVDSKQRVTAGAEEVLRQLIETGTCRDLAWLVGELDRCRGALDVRTVRDLLSELNLGPLDIANYVEEQKDSYCRRCVIRRENYELLVLTWSASQGSVPHDHSGSICGLKVVKGSLTEQFFEETVDGHVRKTSSTRLGPGQITIDPGVVVHALSNSGKPGEVLVTVHIYSPPLPEVRRYAVAEGVPAKSFSRLQTSGDRVIAVIGGGFTGVMTLANLLRLGNRVEFPLRVILLDRQPAIGEGVAYRTTDTRHLLNVPAGQMSAWLDRPGDFVAFARLTDPTVDPSDFLPRKIYGQYVRETVLRLADAAREHMSVAVMHDEVRCLIPSPLSGWDIQTAGGRTVHADLTVLAVGHQPPDDPFPESWTGPRHRLVADPWAALVLTQIRPDEPVLLIGCGLTTVDVIFTLTKQERSARLIALSRRGLMPKAHPLEPPPPGDLPESFARWLDPATPLSIRWLVSTFRHHVASVRQAGVEWQQVIDCLRPYIPRVWQRLSIGERSRFLRHVRPFWEVHRHRMAPAVAAAIDCLKKDQTLEVVAGTLISANADQDGIDVTFSCRGSSTSRSVRVSWVVNCTGPGVHKRDSTYQFLQPLLEAGTISNDELGLGLITDEAGRAVTIDGHKLPTLLVAGILRKATLWESSAVPELVQQAQEVAQTALSAVESGNTQVRQSIPAEALSA